MEKIRKVAIVTGASRGIGACVAAGLAAEGYSLALVARSKDDLEKVAEQIKRNNSANSISVAVYPLDVQDGQSVKEMVANVVSEWKCIDLCFNNAGISQQGTLDVPIEKFEELLHTNLIGSLNFLKAVVPVMKTQKSGYIMNVSSIAGKIGFAGWGAYGASKFALVGLSESLYHELTPLGIKVTCLCPSWVDTDMVKKEVECPSVDEILKPSDLMSTVRWLLSLSPAAVVKDIVIECNTSTSH